MEDFSKILNWKLLYGSHDFPGPDGGTCINEAAIVAAGFAYQKVGHAQDLPACFCPVIGAFSVWLNDNITDAPLRMKLLLPFVTRLAGAKGDAGDERARIEILREHLGRSLPARYLNRRFTGRRNIHILLGEVIGPLTMRRFTLKSARDVRELIRIAEFIRAGLPVAELPAFFGALAGALDAMLEWGPRAEALEINLLVARMEQARRGSLAVNHQESSHSLVAAFASRPGR